MTKSVIFAMLLATASTAFAADRISSPAYRFSLDAADGSKVELDTFKGKVVFLDFWASWCPPCKASMPAVKKLHEKYSGRKDFVVVGINMENISAARKFVEEQGVKYITAVGDDVTARRYGVRGIPTFILIDKKGEIVKRWVGFGENIVEEWTSAIEEALAYDPEPPKPVKSQPRVKKKADPRKK